MIVLIDGNIPAQTACPFLDICKLKQPHCPSHQNLRDKSYSCAAARMFQLTSKPSGKIA